MTIIKCADCGKEFEVSAEERKWYEDKGFELPKRCTECRKARRNKFKGKGRK